MQDPEQAARYKDKLTRELGRTVIASLEDGTTEDLVLFQAGDHLSLIHI